MPPTQTTPHIQADKDLELKRLRSSRPNFDGCAQAPFHINPGQVTRIHKPEISSENFKEYPCSTFLLINKRLKQIQKNYGTQSSSF